LTADEYVLSVVGRYAVPTGIGSQPYLAAQQIVPLIRGWAGHWLLGIEYSGSFAKGTAVHGDADIDLFISLSRETPFTLQNIFNNLIQYFTSRGYSVRQQDVSVRVSLGNISIDLVPGKKQAGLGNDHSLYRRSRDSWTLTNVQKHIKTLKDSNRQVEIRALKIWALLHALDFPSFFLELVALKALAGRASNTPATNVLACLRYIATNLRNVRIVDPSNSNNIVSNDLSLAQKDRIAAQASLSAQQSAWGSIIW
jgi:hypothetical protein